MKKVVLILSLMLLLCSCAAETKDESEIHGETVSDSVSNIVSVEISENNSSDVTESSEETLKIYMTYMGLGQYVSVENEQFVRELFTTGEWMSEVAECVSNYTVAIDGILYDYSVDCGIINGGGKSKQLNETEKNEFNAILADMFN